MKAADYRPLTVRIPRSVYARLRGILKRRNSYMAPDVRDEVRSVYLDLCGASARENYAERHRRKFGRRR